MRSCQGLPQRRISSLGCKFQSAIAAWGCPAEWRLNGSMAPGFRSSGKAGPLASEDRSSARPMALAASSNSVSGFPTLAASALEAGKDAARVSVLPEGLPSNCQGGLPPVAGRSAISTASLTDLMDEAWALSASSSSSHQGFDPSRVTSILQRAATLSRLQASTSMAPTPKTVGGKVSKLTPQGASIESKGIEDLSALKDLLEMIIPISLRSMRVSAAFLGEALLCVLSLPLDLCRP